MSVVDAVGWVAALSAASLAVPQGVRIAKSRSVAGVSSMAWQTTLIGSLAWTAHGLLHGTPQLIWPYAILTVTSAWVLQQLAAARTLSALRTWLPPVLVAAVAFGTDVSLGPVAFAAVAFIPSAAGQLSQLREILRTADPAGVSMVALVATFAGDLLWLAYAVPSREIAILSEGIPVWALATTSMTALWLRRRALVQASHGASDLPTELALTDVIAAPETVDGFGRANALNATAGSTILVSLDTIIETGQQTSVLQPTPTMTTLAPTTGETNPPIAATAVGSDVFAY